jgi:uridine kinase
MSPTTGSTQDSQFIERAEQLLTLLRTDFGIPRTTRTVIAVAGESGSGKSVTAIDLAAVLNRAGIGAAIIHQDDYFIRPPWARRKCSST